MLVLHSQTNNGDSCSLWFHDSLNVTSLHMSIKDMYVCYSLWHHHSSVFVEPGVLVIASYYAAWLCFGKSWSWFSSESVITPRFPHQAPLGSDSLFYTGQHHNRASQQKTGSTLPLRGRHRNRPSCREASAIDFFFLFLFLSLIFFSALIARF